MKIGLLARNPDLYSHRRLVEAAHEHGHEMEIINTTRCYMKAASRSPMVYFQSRELNDFDAVIPRIGASVTFYGAAVVRQFEMMGVWSLNESVAIVRSRDKLRSLQLLSRRNIGLPVTAFSHDSSRVDELIDMVGGTPVVIKLLEGTQGKGVILAETRDSARSVIQAFRGANIHILVQEFIAEAGGADIRCLVVGERVVGAMMRQAPEGEFRSNLHQGGTAHKVRITPEERKTAVRAAKAMGLNLCGVDLLRGKDGPVVMEVNSSPGLEGIEKATNIDIAGKVIAFIAKNAKPHKTRTRGTG